MLPSTCALSRLLTAHDTVSILGNQDRVVIRRQCSRTGTSSSSALGPPIGWKTLHEFMSERDSEGEVRVLRMLNLPESERVEDADIDQPPHQACPALATLPTWRVGVVKLIDHVDGEGGV